ncbi:D-Ala-D-Ala carboxypeptidase family metallohydrolase [Verrucomicrobiales bacterium BCK34]|nr:D-Ala-D-Ala carboxypeptidase family metallohydrolase [Verrucomicrobiales bacterium BCK34]
MNEFTPDIPDNPPTYTDAREERRRARQYAGTRRQALRALALSGLAAGVGAAALNPRGIISLANSTRSLRFGIEDWLKGEGATRVLPKTEEYTAFLNSLNLRYITDEEIIRPHRNVRNGVENHLPPEHMWKRLAPTLKIADQVRHELGSQLVCINSAYRSPEYNAVCSGAASRSYHMKNCALDLIFASGPEKAAEAAMKLRESGAFRGGIGTYAGFIHIDTRGHNATWTS